MFIRHREKDKKFMTTAKYKISEGSIPSLSAARTCDHLIMSHKHLKYSFICKDTENIGILELHVIPNVCSEYSEQN